MICARVDAETQEIIAAIMATVARRKMDIILNRPDAIVAAVKSGDMKTLYSWSWASNGNRVHTVCIRVAPNRAAKHIIGLTIGFIVAGVILLSMLPGELGRFAVGPLLFIAVFYGVFLLWGYDHFSSEEMRFFDAIPGARVVSTQ